MGPGAGFPGMMFSENALKGLNLSDKQKTKLEGVLKAEREAIQKIHEDFLKALREVLDEDQIKKLEKAQPKPTGPGGFPGFPGQPKKTEA
jgi:Spy/CpxP family protein refolding chaperone